MNKKSSISSWIWQAAERLADAMIPSALLDAELILAETLRKPRTYLHAHPDDEIDPRRVDIAEARLNLRLDRVPLAYILGYKEFYGRKFKVSPQVLVPRPESEAIIELLKKFNASGRLIDIGTGSGCLGITAKLELPQLDVVLADISDQALHIARHNAAALNADVTLIKSNLLRSAPGTFDIIVANLPYVDESWARSPETNHEPSLALFAGDGGLELINRLIEQTFDSLVVGGWVFLESDQKQQAKIIAKAKTAQLVHRATDGFCMAFQKMS